jgi:hypothetical protein
MVMIEIKLNEAAYPIRTSWNDVTLSAYCDIVKAKGKPLAERLAIYSGIPIETVNALNFEQLAMIADLTAFMDNPDIVHAFAVGYESELNIGDQPYWKVEKAKQLLKNNPHPITVGAEIVELYTGDKDGEGGQKISDRPVTEVIGMCAFFLTYCQSSLSGSNV